MVSHIEHIHIYIYIKKKKKKKEKENLAELHKRKKIIAVGKDQKGTYEPFEQDELNKLVCPHRVDLRSSMVEHCSANAEAMGSSPVEFPQNFFGFICNCLSCNNHCNDHIFIQNLYFGSSHHLPDLRATDSMAHFTNNVRLSELCEL